MLGTIKDIQSKLGSSKTEMTKAATSKSRPTMPRPASRHLKASQPGRRADRLVSAPDETFFANQQIDKATARLENSAPFKEPELANWMNYNWLIDLPQADFCHPRQGHRRPWKTASRFFPSPASIFGRCRTINNCNRSLSPPTPPS